jgi:hypothetical protein
MAASARHETRALLRAHLAAATGYRHLTHHCPVCHQLLRLAMQPERQDAPEARDALEPVEAHEVLEALEPREDESPANG